MQAQQINIDTIANNIANVNTTGFKQGRAEFQDLLYQNLRPAGTASSSSTTYPVGLQLGLGTRPVATDRNTVRETSGRRKTRWTSSSKVKDFSRFACQAVSSHTHATVPST
jgi:flagellar basal body rod protein FlgG